MWKSKAYFRWLHFSDLHIDTDSKRTQHWGHSLAKLPKSIEDIEKTMNEGLANPSSWNVVFLSGDLTQTGAAEQFTILDQRIKSTRILGESGRGPILLAVPGNHDLVYDNSTPAKTLARLHDPNFLTKEQRKEVERELWAPAKRECGQIPNTYQKAIARAFSNYEAWWGPYRQILIDKADEPNSRWAYNDGLFPGDYTVSIPIGSPQTKPVGVLALNTSFSRLRAPCSEGGRHSRPKLVVGESQILAACGDSVMQWAKKHSFCLLLTHHRALSLTEDTRMQFATLAGTNKFYAHLRGQTQQRQSYDGRGEERHESLPSWAAPSLFGNHEFLGRDGKPIDRPSTGYAAGLIELENSSIQNKRLYSVHPAYYGSRSPNYHGDWSINGSRVNFKRRANNKPNFIYIPMEAKNRSPIEIHAEFRKFKDTEDEPLYNTHIIPYAATDKLQVRLKELYLKDSTSMTGPAVIVHVSSHGLDGTDPDGDSLPLDPDDFGIWLQELKPTPQLVFLSGCSTIEQAPHIAKRIDFVVGATREFTSDVGITFAKKFYMHLAQTRLIPEALRLAERETRISFPGEVDDLFRLWNKEGASPHALLWED